MYDKIISSVKEKSGGISFPHPTGGTDKTLVTLLLSKVRQQNRITAALTWAGIATTPLAGGRKTHSLFKLTLNRVTNDIQMYDMNKGSGSAEKRYGEIV